MSITNLWRHEGGGAPTVLGGRYRLIRPLASSEQGALHLAAELHLNRSVEIFLPTPATTGGGRFSTLVRFLERLSHPNCVSVVDAGTTESGQPFAVLPHVEGQRLRDILGAGPLAPTRVHAVLAAVLDGLTEIHRCGALHRNLTPDCIIVPPNGDSSACITGFWSASVPSEGQARATTLADLSLGAAEYSSPEQALGRGTDERSDLYALGIVAFEMLHGTPPFGAHDPFDVLQLHISAPLPPIGTHVPPELAAFVTRLTHKDPSARFASAREAAVALENAPPDGPGTQRRTTLADVRRSTSIASGQIVSQRAASGGDAEASTMPVVINEPRRQLSWVLPVMLTLLVAALGYGVWSWDRSTPEPSAADPAVAAAAAVIEGTPASAHEPLELSDTLRSLAIVNERRPEHAVEFSQRRALVAELVDQGHGDKIDQRLQTALDLMQAGQSPTPCATFAAALSDIEQSGDEYYAAFLARAAPPNNAPGAGEPPDSRCDELGERIAAVSKPDAESEAEPRARSSSRRDRRSRTRSRRKRKPEPPEAVPEPTPAPRPETPSKATDLPNLKKVQDDIKRL